MLVESKKQLHEFLEDLKKSDANLKTIEEVVTESKGLLYNSRRSFIRIIGKEKQIFGFPEIPQPISTNKQVILDWIYEECEEIFNQYMFKSNKRFNEVKDIKDIPFLLKPFTYSTKDSTDYNRHDELMKIEAFILKPRIEKINQYQFEDEDLKRIEEALTLYNSLKIRMNYKMFSESFKYTDKLLAAYFNRKFINHFFNEIYYNFNQ
jgi:hypothetical protein